MLDRRRCRWLTVRKTKEFEEQNLGVGKGEVVGKLPETYIHSHLIIRCNCQTQWYRREK